jgi:hypothetical protein
MKTTTFTTWIINPFFVGCKKWGATRGSILKLGIIGILGLAIVLMSSQPARSEEASGDNWEFSASAYMWGASIGGESAAGGDIDIDFSDLLDNMNFAFMGSFGANKGKWGFLTDVIYMDVEDDDNEVLGPGLTLSDVELKAWIVTPMVTYRVLQSDRVELNVLAGARYLYLKVELDIEPLPKSSDSGDVWDGIVGVRGSVKLNKHWYLPFHFDVGTGDTDLTWQAFGAVGYKFSSFDLVAGYRYLAWEFDDDDKGGGTFNDLDISGPMVGVKFVF